MDQVVAWMQKRWRGLLGLFAVAMLSFAAVVTVGTVTGGDDGGIRVVETGFSNIVSDSLFDVSYGVVIENTTDEVAYHTVACVDLQLDTDDYTVDDGDGCRQPFTVEVLMPGQRVGFGRFASLTDADVRDMSVEIRGPATWEEPDEYDRGEIVASDLEVAYSPENHPVVSFAGQSGYELDVVRNATAYAVFRNDDDEIVGAVGTDLPASVVPQERARHTITSEAPLPEVATAEVYVFPSGL